MIAFLGIDHLLEFSWTQAIVGFFAAFMTFYAVDYFIFERVQLYTDDVIHKRMGFVMFWGGIVVYGWLFILPLWGLAAHPDPGFSTAWRYVWLIGTAALFGTGRVISRGSNMQKYTFKRWPDRKFLGLIEPKYGVARHFNYMGEWCLALSLALAFGHFGNLWAWPYLFFSVSLFIARQRDDDKLCAEKYGADKWADYRARVKYRIVPGIY